MLKSFKAKALVTGATAAFGIVAMAGTAHAVDKTVYLSTNTGVIMASATSYGANGAVQVCDLRADGYGAYVEYNRVVSTGSAIVRIGDHVDTCASSSNIESNPVARFRICLNSTNCGLWAYTGRS